MRRLAALVILAAALVACGPSAADYVDEYGGPAAMYERIASTSDCDALELEHRILSRQLDEYRRRALATRPTEGYRTAVEDRMAALDCSG